jgi:predicted RNase H-like HicB family nuclease
VKIAIRIEKRPAGGFRAHCPALPGCVEYGRSRQEASRRIARAVEGYVASMNAQQPVHTANRCA